jgi:hypothetical protein
MPLPIGVALLIALRVSPWGHRPAGAAAQPGSCVSRRTDSRHPHQTRRVSHQVDPPGGTIEHMADWIDCVECGRETEHVTVGCTDGHGEDCPERVCAECGWIVVIGPYPDSQRPAIRPAA